MRDLEVAPERIERWLSGFAERHGEVSLTSGPYGPVRAEATDGAVAELEWFPHQPVGLVLVRRGGYAVGLARDGRLVESKVGTRYVQSRTAAGGWSQQRFARRRGNQADALVDAVASHTVRILLPGRPAGLVLGGDRALVAQVLDDARLRSLLRLPRRELYDVGDPRRDVLERAVERGRAVRVRLTEPTEQVPS